MKAERCKTWVHRDIIALIAEKCTDSKGLSMTTQTTLGKLLVQQNKLFVPIRDQNGYWKTLKQHLRQDLFLSMKEGINPLMLKMNKYECQLVNNKQLKTKPKKKEKDPKQTLQSYHFLQLERNQHKHCSFVTLSKCNWCTVNKTEFSQRWEKNSHTNSGNLYGAHIQPFMFHCLASLFSHPNQLRRTLYFSPPFSVKESWHNQHKQTLLTALNLEGPLFKYLPLHNWNSCFNEIPTVIILPWLSWVTTKQ